jgi:hypothetical protein
MLLLLLDSDWRLLLHTAVLLMLHTDLLPLPIMDWLPPLLVTDSLLVTEWTALIVLLLPLLSVWLLVAV